MDSITLVFVGAMASLILTGVKEFMKKRGIDLSPAGSMASVAVLSLVAATVYVSLSHFGYWDAFLRIITAAGAFYAFVTRNVQQQSKPDNGSEV